MTELNTPKDAVGYGMQSSSGYSHSPEASDSENQPVSPRSSMTVDESGRGATYTDSSGTVYQVPEWIVKHKKDYVQRLIYRGEDNRDTRSEEDFRAAGFPKDVIDAAERQIHVPHHRHGAQYAAGFLTPQEIFDSIEHALDEEIRFDEDIEEIDDTREGSGLIPENPIDKEASPERKNPPEEITTAEQAKITPQTAPSMVRRMERKNAAGAEKVPLKQDAEAQVPTKQKMQPDGTEQPTLQEEYAAPVHLSESMASYRKTLQSATAKAPEEKPEHGIYIITEEKPRSQRRKHTKAPNPVLTKAELPETSSRQGGAEKTTLEGHRSEAVLGVQAEDARIEKQNPVSDGKPSKMNQTREDSRWLAVNGEIPHGRTPVPRPNLGSVPSRKDDLQGTLGERKAELHERADGHSVKKKSKRILYATVCIVLGCLCLLYSAKLAVLVKRAISISKLETEIRLLEERRVEEYGQYVNEHPFRYREKIESTARKYNVSPAFVAAIVLNESSFRTDATSGVGARGLMQLMDDTAQWIHSKLQNGKSYSFDKLYEADTNLEYGCWYLQYLGSLFQGDPVLVAAAFHAGQGEIINWLNDSRYSKDGRTIQIENMPEGPTRVYVKRVMKAFGDYQRLYYDTLSGRRSEGE